LDRWIVARLDETTLDVRDALDVYDAERATMRLESFLDDLSNWYVRRSRRRFWKSEADDDKLAAYATLYHVLVSFTKLLAPFIPFITEAMYQNLIRSVDEQAPMSVHHCLFPTADRDNLDRRLLDKMRLAITTASLGRAARGSADIKLRQPLARARVNVGSKQERDDLRELAPVLAEEINVKEIEVVSEVGELVNYKLLPNNRVLGPRFGRQFPQVRAALMDLDAAQAAAILHAGDALSLELDGEEVLLSEEDVLVLTESPGGLAVASDKGVTVAVDTELTPELEQEGYARDLVRTINNMRKEAGLDIADRIDLAYQAGGDVAAAMNNFAGYIQQETLVVDLSAGTLANPLYSETVTIGDEEVTLALQKSKAS
jgi:isoleucyl-tRNA synthetase